ncbi:MAG: efflux RND transporter permease subunit [Clostridiaceae bacterium]|nr:efflux RND transporter permease subunit [Clostridiaceae bacterium]
MKVSNWSVNRPISVFMMMGIILLLGAVSLSRLPMDLLPKMNIPVAVVNTQYIGAGPLEIENLITRPIEETVATVNNVKHINSVSTEGSSVVIIEFDQGTDMDFATLEIREKIDLVKRFLPQDAIDPMVLKIDPNALPIMAIGVIGEDIDKLQDTVEHRIKPRLERLEGVAAVGVSGGREKNVEIKIDPTYLAEQKINQQQLSALLRGENINLPGGEIKDGSKNLMVRTIGEFRSIDEIKNLPVPLPIGITTRLQDIAEVRFVEEERTQLARVNGIPSIRVTLQKQPTFNTIQVTNAVNREIKEIQQELDDIEIETVIDQSLFIRRSIGNVATTAAFGGLLAVLVLFLFTKNMRNTLVIALSIPISIIATFTLMYFTGLTLNLLSLGGFALGIGMLVDNGIVVLENIYRFREEGYSAKDAAIYGATEVASAVTASTFTTVAVFIPIVFVEGMTGEIFKELALTVTFALLASLVISLTLVPMLSSKILKVKNKKSNKVFQRIDNVFQRVNDKYIILLKWSLQHRLGVLLLTFIIFFSSILSVVWVGAEYFPEFDEGTFKINIMLPQGSSLESTEEIVQKVEQVVADYEDVEVIFSNIGGGDEFFSSYGYRPHRASVDVRLVPYNSRKQNTLKIIDEVRNDLIKIPGAEITVSNLSLVGMGFAGEAVEVEIRGDSLDILQDISQSFMEIIQTVEGTREVTSNFTEGRPQLEVYLNRDITSLYGLQTFQVATSIRNIIQGMDTTKLRIDGKEHNIVIKGEDYLKDGIGNFMQTPIETMLGNTVPLEQITEYRIAQGPSAIRRSSQVRTISVTAAIINRDVNSVISDIEDKLQHYPLPAGYTYQYRGQMEQLEEAFANLALAVILAILLVYMILASQFQSLLYPFTIMLSVPLAFSGGALALLLRGQPLSVPAVIGLIVLAGIVVNNGIVLIDYINLLRKESKEINDAIIMAGSTRLRPIAMTTLTTVLGLLPLAIGINEGSEVQIPLATVVIGGLLLSTLLTLIVLPVVYSILNDVKLHIIKRE